MKLFKYIFLSVSVILLSCNDLTDLDINTNPNAPSLDQTEPNFLFNRVQLSFADVFNDTWSATSRATRQRAMTSFFYNTTFSAESFDNLWFSAYSNFFLDANTLISLSEERGANQIEASAAKVMSSYILTTLVDLFGSVPYSDAFQGTDAISPALDGQEALYAEAIRLLDDAISVFDSQDDFVNPGSGDLFYGGDQAAWSRLANTLKLRIYNNTRLVDGEAGSKAKAIIDSGNFISDDGQDFAFKYGTERTNPDSRHPFYEDDYEADDSGYMNNYYMWLLVGEKPTVDPRTRFYFYRQVSSFSESSIDANDWDCVLTNTPFDPIPPGQFDHISSIDPDLPFCIASADGYMGRDHGNGQGIPPDGPLRVEYGVYPGGGAYDNNSFTFTQTGGTLGALGEGIAPIWMAPFTDFIRAELALEAGTGEDARELLASAVSKSINSVSSFAQAIIPASDLNRVIATDPVTMEDILASSLIPTDEDVQAYVDYVLAEYDAASDKLDVVMKEYYIAMWGNGVESYNMYRRTGKPGNMQPLVDPQAASTASFPRLFLYPNNFVSRNSNVSQRETTEQVFWDTNPAGFIR